MELIHATKINFVKLLSQSKCSVELQDELWLEITNNYQGNKRHYHNLYHLDAMFIEMEKFKSEIEDVEMLSFSIWYHDIIYNARKSNNEELSAERAKVVLSLLNKSEDTISRCFHQILATKTHVNDGNQDFDLMYLLDFDLEVLGRAWPLYLKYCNEIRNEYSIYPWFAYRQGRKKALRNFLARERIYQTNYYYEMFESVARDNIQREIDELL